MVFFNFKTSLRGSKRTFRMLVWLCCDREVAFQPTFLPAQISWLIKDHHSDFFLDYCIVNQLRILSGLKVIAEVNAEARSFLDWQHYWLAPLLVDATDILLGVLLWCESYFCWNNSSACFKKHCGSFLACFGTVSQPVSLRWNSSPVSSNLNFSQAAQLHGGQAVRDELFSSMSILQHTITTTQF